MTKARRKPKNFSRPKTPVAMFSVAEVEKYNKYAQFGVPTEVVGEATPGNMRSADPSVSPSSSAIQRYSSPGALVGGKPRIKLSPVLLAAAVPVVAAGAAGAMFLRRRRTKKGKIVVEQVRRK